MSLVLYRKYRPKNFSDVVNQKHIVKTLTNAISSDRVAHAYLFTGPRGTGKTTIARLLAKAVNCEKNQQDLSSDASDPRHSMSFEPCNKCSACRQISEGRSMDLIEVDAASNRGIDEIRELRDGIKFSPNSLKSKVFIIDEVHQLTKEAFNALLKTLEEPPAHAIFILATTEIHKMPQTIISRCQRFDFHKIGIENLLERLVWISKQEKVKIEKSALEMIARNAEGSVRDAESLLGQIMSMAVADKDKGITLKDVQDVLAITDLQAVQSLAEYLLNKKTGEAIAHVNDIANQGYDLVQFSKSFAGYLRKMMLLKIDDGLYNLAASELTQEQKDTIISLGEKVSREDLLALIRIFLEAQNQVKYADFPQLPLELAIIEGVESDKNTH